MKKQLANFAVLTFLIFCSLLFVLFVDLEEVSAVDSAVSLLFGVLI